MVGSQASQYPVLSPDASEEVSTLINASNDHIPNGMDVFFSNIAKQSPRPTNFESSFGSHTLPDDDAILRKFRLRTGSGCGVGWVIFNFYMFSGARKINLVLKAK